jgi:glutathione synthase/RimK-type ligase-like ATP-grasp enzyme
MILIVTTQSDTHADVVIKKLESLGVEFVRFNTEDFPTKVSLEIELNSSFWKGYLCFQSRRINIRDIKAVWYRRPGTPEIHPDVKDDRVKQVCLAQAEEALRGLWRSLDVYWMSNPINIQKASSKIYQLSIAPYFGFKIPDTLITLSPKEAIEFWSKHQGNVIVKPLSGIGFLSPKTQTPAGVYTSKVEEKDIIEIETVKYAPTLFQEYVPKSIEIRITVVGTKVFAAEIHSQVNEESKHDWRRLSPRYIPHYPHSLPNDLKEKCVKLVQYMGLNFGAIDMIKCPNGDYVFLEINPNGQWLWIEEITGLPISDAIVDSLLSACRR